MRGEPGDGEYILMILFETKLPFPISVNSMYGGGSGQKRFPTKRYKEWIKSCQALEPLNINTPVHIEYTFAWPDKRLRDGQNFMKGVLDFLVNQGVLLDDNYEIVASESWRHAGVEKNNGNVYITIRSA